MTYVVDKHSRDSFPVYVVAGFFDRHGLLIELTEEMQDHNWPMCQPAGTDQAKRLVSLLKQECRRIVADSGKQIEILGGQYNVV